MLVSMLDDPRTAPIGATTIDVRHIVDTFQRFAALPVDNAQPLDQDGDGILAQFGTYDLRDQQEFSADLTRQFIEAGPGDTPMWQLSCTLYWAPSAATDGLASGHLWSFGKTLDEFFDEAVALPGWAWALSDAQAPHDFMIMLDLV